MKTLMFLDDWLLDARIDVDRHFCRARYVRDIVAPKDPVHPARVTWNPALSCYETTLGYRGDKPRVRHSEDGLIWHRGPAPVLRLEGPEPAGLCFDPRVILAPFGGFDVCSPMLADRWDPDPSRRYKRLVFPFTDRATRATGIEGGPGLVACSADGIEWTADSRHVWFSVRNGSDTLNNVIYDPGRGRWQAYCRRYNCDRRIAVCESEDLQDWTDPRIILHPDSMDGQCVQFYGMPAIAYEGYLIGAVQRYRVPQLDEAEPRWAKMSGKVDAQLAYSYDGQLWTRPHRKPLIARSAPGTPGPKGSLYPIQFRVEKDRLVIMALGFSQHHGAPEGETPLCEYELRRHGFCYLEPVGDRGEVHLRAICPEKPGRVRLNLHTERGGYITGRVVEYETHSSYAPIPGYDYDDCLPVSGDKTGASLRWSKHSDLRELAGRRVRLELRLHDARLYAVRADCRLWYTNTPEPVEWV